MRQFRSYGSVRGVRGNSHPYRDDEAGVFAFAGLPPGKYTVLATTNALPAMFTTANPPLPTLTKTPERWP